ncbi:hypothetical protein LMZ02_14175 [Paenibacillus macerans]|uniref:hypothetical protein n=1 Tax=Paenibacillus macerans TaxID=44252 RepID=UPI0018C2A4F0|nr:hypothetical protein [Paenibacillus macerans]UMV50418.1 hypothetical protein LMZ02_14175 [Paenibacillus macerans]
MSEGRIGRTIGGTVGGTVGRTVGGTVGRTVGRRTALWDQLVAPKVQLKWLKPGCLSLREESSKNIRAKKGVIPAASVHLREVGTIYVAIFSNDKEMTAFWTFHRKISTKNAANGNKHA